MKYFLFIIILCCCVMFVSQPLYAHTLITDTTGQKGAILHVNPDDDPIAGKQAALYFDTQGNLLTKQSRVTLTIKGADKQPVTVETTINDSLVMSNYTFASQGIYYLHYTVTTDGISYSFDSTLRVSRGVVTLPLQKNYYPWADALLGGCVLTALCLLILIGNNRKEIAHQSTF